MCLSGGLLGVGLYISTAVKHLCDLMLDAIKAKRKPAQVKVDVLPLKKEFNGVKYASKT